MKKLIPLILIALLLSACTSPAAAPAATTEATTTPALTVAPTEKPTPIPEPTPTPEPVQEKFDWAPEIDGLIKEIREKDGEKKVVYLYLGDNPYGGEEGEYAGEYKAEVTLILEDNDLSEGEEWSLRGLSLSSKVIEKFINDYHNGRILGKSNASDYDVEYCTEGKGPVPIPIDISSLSSNSEIIISDEKGKINDINGFKSKVLKIEVTGVESLVLRSVILENEVGFLEGENFYGSEIISKLSMSPEWSEMSYDPDKKRIKSGVLPYALSICGEDLDANIDNTFNFGQELCSASPIIYLYFSYNWSDIMLEHFIEYLYVDSDISDEKVPPIRDFVVFISE